MKVKNSWPFEAWHQVAVRRFNLQPSEFWEMPVGDWLNLLNGIKTAGFDQKTLADLLEIYPDEGGENELD